MTDQPNYLYAAYYDQRHGTPKVRITAFIEQNQMERSILNV